LSKLNKQLNIKYYKLGIDNIGLFFGWFFGVSLFDSRAGGESILVQEEVFLSDGDLSITLLAPVFTPGVFNDPVLFTFIALAPSDDLDGVSTLEFRGTFRDSVDATLVDEEVSVGREVTNDGTVFKDVLLDSFSSRGDAVVLDSVFLALFNCGVARNVVFTLVGEAVFVNETSSLGEIEESSNVTTAAFSSFIILLARKVLLGTQSDVLSSGHAESVGDGASGGNGERGGAVLLVDDGAHALGIGFSEVVVRFEDSSFIQRGTSGEGLLVGEVVAENLFGIGQSLVLEERVGAELVAIVIVVMGFYFVVFNDWSEM